MDWLIYLIENLQAISITMYIASSLIWSFIHYITLHYITLPVAKTLIMEPSCNTIRIKCNILLLNI